MAEQKISVLYVDDETSLLDLGKLFLERMGSISVDTSPSAQKALEMIVSGDYDVIVSDYMMPGMDGIEFLIEVRKTDERIPFIIFTGRGREEIVIQAINNGADFYLQKGGDPKAQYFELTSKIVQAVERRRAEAELLRKHDELSAAYEQLAGQGEELQSQLIMLQEQEVELRRINDQITGIADTIPGVVFQFYAKNTGETGLSYVSSRVYEILGVEGDLSNFFTRFTAGIHPDDRDGFLSSVENAVKIGSKWQFEGRFKRPDGRLIFLKGMSAPVRVQDGLLFSGVILDVTSEQEAKECLASEKMFSQLLLDASPAFVVAIGFDGKTIMMNQLLLDTLGYTADEVMGKDYLDTFVPERDRAELAGVFSSIIQKNIITSSENRIISKSGVEYLVEWHGRPVPGSSGIRDFFVGVGIDITHRREEEERLRRSEERYRSLIETTGTGYVALDEEGKVLDANDEYVRLTGRSSIKEILGKPVTDWTAPDDLARNAEEVRRCFESGSVRGLRIDYIHPDGSLCPVEINASVFRSEEGTVILTLCRKILNQPA